MNDLISRQAAIEAIEKCHKMCCREDACGDEWIHYETVLNEVECISSAEPKRGTWIDGIIPNDSGGLPVIVCDQCNTFFPLQFGDGHNFCPNCGADMRQREE